MNIELNQDGICMKPKQVVKVRGGIGHSIVCHSGTVWVTQDGDLRDVVLHAGQSFMLNRKGPALVQAFEQSAISIERPAAQVRPGMPAALLARVASGAGFPRGAVGG